MQNCVINEKNRKIQIELVNCINRKLIKNYIFEGLEISEI